MRMSVALKPSQALGLWRDVVLNEVTEREHDLTTRQMAILLSIYMDPPPHTVRGLAAKLNVTKPVITRALDTMGQMKLVMRRRDPKDRRNVIIGKTVEGALYLERFSDLVVEKAKWLAK